MTSLHPPLAEIDDPHEDDGWRVIRPEDAGTLHTEVLRELCDRGRVLHLGAARMRGVPATLQLVDVMQHRLVLASHADGIAIARVLQARPLWASAHLHSLGVQFALMAAGAAREGVGKTERFVIEANWPREIYRKTRQRAQRQPCLPEPSPVARFHHSNQLVSTRDFAVMELSERGGAVLLPAGMAPPARGSSIRRIELELDDEHIVFTDANVRKVIALGRGTHRVACRWECMPSGGQHTLRRWLAHVGVSLAAPLSSAGD